MQDGAPIAECYLGNPSDVMDDYGLVLGGAAEPGIDGAGGDHAGAAGGGQAGATLVGAHEDLVRGDREQDGQVGAGREPVAAGGDRLAHRDQVGFDELVRERDQVRVGHADGGEGEARVKDIDPRFHLPELDPWMLQPDLPHALRRDRATADRVLDRAGLGRAGLDHGLVGAAQVEDDPAQAAHAVAAELGRRPVRIEEPRARHWRARIVKVGAVAAELTAPVTQGANECSQVSIAGEVGGSQRDEENVVPRAVRLEYLCHDPTERTRAAGPLA